MPLETDFPGLKWEIETLRKGGLDDEMILRGIAERAQFHRQSGYTGEAINAWLQGRPGPIGLNVQRGMPPTKDQVRKLKEFEESTTLRSAGVDPETTWRTGRAYPSNWRELIQSDNPLANTIMEMGGGFV